MNALPAFARLPIQGFGPVAIAHEAREEVQEIILLTM